MSEYTDKVADGLRCSIPDCMGLGWRGRSSDPHHIRTKGAGGKDESNVAPLCWDHHTEGHRIGWQTWAERHGICLPAVALFVRLWVLDGVRAGPLRYADGTQGEDLPW